MSTFSLLRTRRFLPFFCTQFLGAFNDNLFKNAMVMLLTFGAAHGASEAESGMVIILAGGVLILPFFLFSSAAGQIADKYEKSQIMRAVKLAEIFIMALGGVGFFLHSTPILFVTLFLMGTHSAFFGPAKYSVLPQHLKENELVAGNAAVEMGTFLAILLGTLGGGILAGSRSPGLIVTGIIGVAVLGYLASRFVPLAPATAPDLKLNWNPFTETMALFKLTRQKESVFNSILGISWFWYFGAVLLAEMPNFTKHALGGDESVATLLLAVFSVSIGVGAFICERLSRGDIELGVVPLGALAMSVFCGDLFLINYPTLAEGAAGVSVSAYLAGPNAFVLWRTIFDMAMIGIFSSLFIVPLYALIQFRSDEATRSRIIAANNVFNAVFMVASALITMALFKLGMSTIQVLLTLAVMNLVVCGYVFTLIPEFFLRFGIWILASTIYRLKYEGQEKVPKNGGCIIVCNHVSFIDWLIITAACRRPARFVMDHNYFKMPIISLFFRMAKAIPIAPSKEDPKAKEKAFERIAWELRDGNVVCIFPEGRITQDGKLNPFKPGIERMLADTAVPVIPMAIKGLWGSFFSRRNRGHAMRGVPKPTRRLISVTVGEVLPPTVKAAELEELVLRLSGMERASNVPAA